MASDAFYASADLQFHLPRLGLRLLDKCDISLDDLREALGGQVFGFLRYNPLKTLSIEPSSDTWRLVRFFATKHTVFCLRISQSQISKAIISKKLFRLLCSNDISTAGDLIHIFWRHKLVTVLQPRCGKSILMSDGCSSTIPAWCPIIKAQWRGTKIGSAKHWLFKVWTDKPNQGLPLPSVFLMDPSPPLILNPPKGVSSLAWPSTIQGAQSGGGVTTERRWFMQTNHPPSCIAASLTMSNSSTW